MTKREQYFTAVFKGDLQAIDGNPFHVETPFGRPIAIARGDALEKLAPNETYDGSACEWGQSSKREGECASCGQSWHEHAKPLSCKLSHQ